MEFNYIKTPHSISITTVMEKDFSLSPSPYKDLDIKNKNCIRVKDFLSRPLKRADLGNEVGSINYIGNSSHYFIRTKALQAHSYIPEINSETTIPIKPKAFVFSDLKEGDLLISKDSNIGEIVILDKDYPNFMTSGALYKLPVVVNKWYFLAFVKHPIFKEQIETIVPKGATIRHAKTMFLDCLIPLPNYKRELTINFIEVITQAIVNKERLIQKRHKAILKLIEQELLNNQKPSKFNYELPRLSEVEKVGRLDTSRYSKAYKEYEFLIQNYKGGSFKLSDFDYKVKRGQNLQVSNIGPSYYSKKSYEGFYNLAVSSNFSEYSTLEQVTYLGNQRKLSTIKRGDIVFSARGAQFGRVLVFPEEIANTITNIDSLVIHSEQGDINRSIFIAMFLNNLRWNKHIYKIAITGSGANSLTQYQSDDINFPNFPDEVINEISKLYWSGASDCNVSDCDISNFITTDDSYNLTAGIYELDKSCKKLRELLNITIESIIKDKEVAIHF